VGLLDWIRRQRKKQKEEKAYRHAVGEPTGFRERMDAKAAERRQHIREKFDGFKQRTAPVQSYVERKFTGTPEERREAKSRREWEKQNEERMKREGRAFGYGAEMGRRQARDEYYQRRSDERRFREAGNPKHSFFDNYQDPFDTFPKRKKRKN